MYFFNDQIKTALRVGFLISPSGHFWPGNCASFAFPRALPVAVAEKWVNKERFSLHFFKGREMVSMAPLNQPQAFAYEEVSFANITWRG